jgi:hypothetical protein
MIFLDIKLLEQYYCVWKNGSHIEYHLNCSAVDKTIRSKLEHLIQTGIKRAIEDGSIVPLNDNRPPPFISSFIEQVAHKLITDTTNKHIFVLRTFKGRIL